MSNCQKAFSGLVRGSLGKMILVVKEEAIGGDE
jgi:hypothetical protein